MFIEHWRCLDVSVLNLEKNSDCYLFLLLTVDMDLLVIAIEFIDMSVSKLWVQLSLFSQLLRLVGVKINWIKTCEVIWNPPVGKYLIYGSSKKARALSRDNNVESYLLPFSRYLRTGYPVLLFHTFCFLWLQVVSSA